MCPGGQESQWDPRVRGTEHGQQGREVLLPSALHWEGGAHLQHCTQCGAAQLQADWKLLERAQLRVQRWWGAWSTSCWGEDESPGAVHVEERRLRWV